MTIRLLSTLACCLFMGSPSPARADDDQAPADAPAEEPAADASAPAPDAAVIDRLFEEHKTPASFTDALEAARAAGVAPQLITEAEMVHYLFRNMDIAGVRKTLVRIEQTRPTFDPDLSRVFRTKREFDAMAEYAKAIIALTNGDEQALKTHITEAFWLNPAQARAFGELVQGFRARNPPADESPETPDPPADTEE